MPRPKLILLSVLLLALPARAETGPETAPGAQARPLNLSLPRDVLENTSGIGQANETAVRNLEPRPRSGGLPETPARPASLPYGAGYEHRHQEMRGAGGSPKSGAGSGPGRRGR